MIVVATADFEVYHDVVAALRDRQVSFTTIEPGEDLPAEASAVIVGPDEAPTVTGEEGVPVITAEPGEGRVAVEAALDTERTTGDQVIVGIDPGTRPGIAVLVDGMLVSAFQVPLEDTAQVVREEIEGASEPVVRIGDGARLRGSRLIDELPDVRVELVDETGTTPYLGTGARGMGDVLAAVNIARRSGEPIEGRSIEPTEGELKAIQERSRRESETNRTIPVSLARQVANGELTLEGALATHKAEDTSEDENEHADKE